MEVSFALTLERKLLVMNESLSLTLRKLRLSGLSETLDVRLQEAGGNHLTHAEFLDVRAMRECEHSPPAFASSSRTQQRATSTLYKTHVRMQLISGKSLTMVCRSVYTSLRS
jgi:hypothetical protein